MERKNAAQKRREERQKEEDKREKKVLKTRARNIEEAKAAVNAVEEETNVVCTFLTLEEEMYSSLHFLSPY
jgi:lysozyme family protein